MGIKKTQGDYFEVPPADVWNGMVDAGIDFNDRKRLGIGSGPEFQFIPSDAIKLRNDSGGALVAGRVLEIGASLITTPKRNALWFEGDTPLADGTKGIAITMFPMPSNKIDWCQVSGVCLCRLNVVDITHRRADVDASSTLLQSKTSGRCEILWKSTGSTGEQDALVVLPSGDTSAGNTLWRFELTEDMGATTALEASADLFLMDGTAGPTDVTALDTEDIFDTLVSGSRGLLLEQDGEYHIIQAKC